MFRIKGCTYRGAPQKDGAVCGTPHLPYGPYEKYFKRPLDIVLSLAALAVLSPVMAVTAALVRLRLGVPVLFIQKRPGRDGQLFRLYKFRTMDDRRDASGVLLPDEERLTRFGRKLREMSLDELPELLNILAGDMSLVGPRPLAAQYLPYYTEEERKRHSVRPGLTGLAQVHGRNALSWEERFSYDLAYVGHISLRTDISILARTAREIFVKEDVIVRGTQNSVLDFDEERKQKGSKVVP